MNWHNFPPDNTSQYLSDSSQHLPLLFLAFLKMYEDYQILQTNKKNLIMQPKQKAITNSEIPGLVLKTPRSWLGHIQD